MKTACQAFRRQLESLLATSAPPSARRELGWHGHLLECGPCRELLAGEDALELLLDSLPSPGLPPFLAERVLLRLRTDSHVEARLDRLLELDTSLAEPEGLAGRVREGLLARQEAALDRLLDHAGAVTVPADLGQRVLAGLEQRRVGSLERLLQEAGQVSLPVGLAGRVQHGLAPELARVRRRRLARRVGDFVRGGLAAGLLAAVGLWALDRIERAAPEPSLTQPARLAATEQLPEEGLLECWPALELMGLMEDRAEAGSPDILIGAGLDEADLVLGELDQDYWSSGTDAASGEDQGR